MTPPRSTHRGGGEGGVRGYGMSQEAGRLPGYAGDAQYLVFNYTVGT